MSERAGDVAPREVTRRLHAGWHPCRDGSGFRCWHNPDRDCWEPMIESEAVVLDARGWNQPRALIPGHLADLEVRE